MHRGPKNVFFGSLDKTDFIMIFNLNFFVFHAFLLEKYTICHGMGGDNHGTTFIPFYIMIQLVTTAVKPFKRLEQNVIIMIILCDQLVFGDFNNEI